MNTAEIPFLSASELADAIRAGEVSPVDAVGAYLDRINAVGDKLNAYITVCADEARADAKQMEDEAAAGNFRGPLHGVPVGIKDQIHTAGIRTTDASKIRADFVPDADATVVAKLKAAGAVVIGKTNMSEFAMGDPISSWFGPARNPWDTDRNPGTSSTGSGSATAGFLCATSLGEDTGGSIRGPAANSGLVGIRPTWGRVSRAGVDGASWSTDTIGPISRTVTDCALTLQVIAGHDPKDRYSRPEPVPDYLDGLEAGVRGMRIGVVQELMGGHGLRLDDRSRDAVSAAAEVFRELGAEVLPVSLPIAPFTGPIVRTITSTERVSLNPEWLRERFEDYHPNTRVAFAVGNLIPGQVYYKALKLRALARRQVLQAFRDVDLLLQPTSSGPAGLLSDEPAVIDNKEMAVRSLREGSFRGLYSLSGCPALSIPCGFTSDGDGALPLALQIGGPHLGEAAIFRAAYAYEQATPWHKRRPPAL
ncbi:MAG: amidase [Chloroflexi bacterium]|nr:amidase [Chloroflexota bacterium]MYD49003.1 amidase [Chloroflexota bacterium]